MRGDLRLGPVGEEVVTTVALLALPRVETAATDAVVAGVACALPRRIGVGVVALRASPGPQVAGGQVGPPVGEAPPLHGQTSAPRAGDGAVVSPAVSPPWDDVIEER